MNKRIREDETGVTFSSTITSEGVFNHGLRTGEEIERIVPLTSDLPLIIDHPPTPAVPADQTKIGIISNPKLGMKDGLKVINTEITIFNEFPEMIRRVEEEENSEVSMGYWYEDLKTSGEFKGDKYTHIRSQIKPTHVGLLVNMTPAACTPPQCGIGLDSDKIRDGGMKAKIFIAGMDTHNNDSHKSEGCNMTEEQNDTKKIIKTEEKPLGLGDIGLDSLIKENPCVKSLAAEKEVLLAELKKATVGLDSLQKQVESLTPYKEEADKREAEEVDALRSEVAATKVYSDEETKAMGRDNLEIALKALKSAKVATNLQIPGSGGLDKQNPNPKGLSAGIPTRQPDGTVKWET